jgi:hypothetical protein
LKKETIFEAMKLFPLAGNPTSANTILGGVELGIEAVLLDRTRGGTGGVIFSMISLNISSTCLGWLAELEPETFQARTANVLLQQQPTKLN